MRAFKAILLVIAITTNGYAQAPLGSGIVRIEFDGNTVVDFYKSPADKTFSKRIEFYYDKSISSAVIKNRKEELTWLTPELVWLDYMQFNFRYKSISDNWIEVVVNNNNGQVYWIRKTEQTKVQTWEAYLQDMFSVNRRHDKEQKIRESPNDSANEIKYVGEDCFQVKSMKGDWIEIFTDEYCDDYGSKTKIKSGWIRWRSGDELLIGYSATS